MHAEHFAGHVLGEPLLNVSVVRSSLPPKVRSALAARSDGYALVSADRANANRRRVEVGGDEETPAPAMTAS
jgi:hypothetical protein